MKTSRAAFTLLELLVVMGVIAVMAGLIAVGLAGGNRSTALRSGQALLANLLTAARTHAVASGHDVRLLVQADVRWPERFRRVVVMQENTAGTTWLTLHEASLGKEIYFLSYDARTPTGFLVSPASWKKVDGSTVLQSSALSSAPVSVQAGLSAAETWDFVLFSAKGTSSTSGDLVLAAGRVRAPGSFASGESPVQLENPELVRGVSLSAYGLPSLINGRASF